MPRRDIWVRKEDVEVFDAIADKPAWLHSAIHNEVLMKEQFGERLTPAEDKVAERISNEMRKQHDDEYLEGDEWPSEKPCCKLKNPCKHWIWVGESSAYVNTLSGQHRQVE